MSDVTINYRGNAIATMDASGTKTLQTEGKYCDDDIGVVYVKPAGGDQYTLLASGIFTKTDVNQTLVIPVTYTGTPKLVVVEVKTPLASTNQGYSVAKYIVDSSDPASLQSAAPAGLAVCYYKTSADAITLGAYNPNSIVVTPSSISIGRISGTYLWQQTDYNWYIYG